jgi:hypothetical protein
MLLSSVHNYRENKALFKKPGQGVAPVRTS